MSYDRKGFIVRKEKPDKEAMTLREAMAAYHLAPPEPLIPEERVIGIRELKARASEILREIERTGAGALITRHGAPWGRLIPFRPRGEALGAKGLLRNAYPDLPDLQEEEFVQAKELWSKALNGDDDG